MSPHWKLPLRVCLPGGLYSLVALARLRLHSCDGPVDPLAPGSCISLATRRSEGPGDDVFVTPRPPKVITILVRLSKVRDRASADVALSNLRLLHQLNILTPLSLLRL